jgi:hypothetical protein
VQSTRALRFDRWVERISINKCREIIGEESEPMSDVQVEAFRDAIYTLVESSLDNLDQLGNVCASHE